jgi:hypothetical protein
VGVYIHEANSSPLLTHSLGNSFAWITCLSYSAHQNAKFGVWHVRTVKVQFDQPSIVIERGINYFRSRDIPPEQIFQDQLWSYAKFTYHDLHYFVECVHS